MRCFLFCSLEKIHKSFWEVMHESESSRIPHVLGERTVSLCPGTESNGWGTLSHLRGWEKSTTSRASFQLRRSHCRVQCLSHRPRAWHGTNYTPFYLEGVDVTPRPKATLETLKSRMTEKHNLDFSPSMANHKSRQSPLWSISLSMPMALPWGRDL